MVKAKINVRVDSDVLTQKIKSAVKRAETTVAHEVMKDTSPFVPMRNGKLDQSARVEGNQIIYGGTGDVPYARFLYYGKLMVDPETGSSWAGEGKNKVVKDKNLVFYKKEHQQAQSHWFEASKAQNLEKWERVAAKEVSKELKKK